MSDTECHCDCRIAYGISQCRGCGCTYTCYYDSSGNLINCDAPTCSPADLSEITQKRMWNTVRVPASEYTMNLGSLTVYQPPTLSTGVNWNQMSDRALPSNSNITTKVVVPSHGNSTKFSITKERPGSQRPGGTGVDIKHGSYARYLARLKGKGPLRTQKTTVTNIPLQGNKTKSYGIVKSRSCLCFV